VNVHHLVHFAGFAKHIGSLPIPSGIEAFEDELSHNKRGKGSVQFPLDQPLPPGVATPKRGKSAK
jgi:uncharacterized protein YdhG (YjbR/CyaY superfamily)